MINQVGAFMPEHDVITSDDAINGIIDSKRKNIKVKWFVTENVFD